MKVLLTGGAGYIGCHAFVALVEAGFDPVIVDDFSNSSAEVVDRLRRITGREVACERGDVCDAPFVSSVLRRHGIEAAMHFAAYKSISESIAMPVEYFRNNVGGLVALLAAMDVAAVRTLVYSSSAAVYGVPEACPVGEDAPRNPMNPYAVTKAIGEDVLRSLARCRSEWRIALLRYFNPIGAHEGGLIGEDARGKEAGNLMPAILQVAIGHREHLSCFGNDYPTRDGTGVRDYIHVMDVAEGHVAALKALIAAGSSFTVNIGAGRGYSVLEVVRAFERAAQCRVPVRFEPRRQGDIAECWADASKANHLLGWRARRSLDEMCTDAWRWQRLNSDGYAAVTR